MNRPAWSNKEVRRMYKPVFYLILLLATLFAHSVCADEPDLLLLNKYQPGQDVTGWYISEKLDGVRAWWNGHELLSRKGNRFAAPVWFTQGFPPFELDGELWIGRGRFEEAASITSRAEPHDGWKRLSYEIFEVPNAPGDLDARLRRLHDYLANHPVARIHIIPQLRCAGMAELQARLAQVEAAGGEGLVLRNPVAPYETGRSDNALKVKSYDDMEAEVIGYRAGKGKYAGLVGSLRVRIDGDREFYIGSGLSDQLRLKPPPLGSLITFKYYGLTERGIPRFASFLRVREVIPQLQQKDEY
jgi:DNA ligase-1